MKIEGITVILHDKVQTGVDAFNEPVYEDTAVEVDDVLVGQPTAQENLDTTNLYGKQAIYTLAIPKGDTHDWMDKKISFFGRDFHSFGIPLEGIEANIPLRWNKKVTVEVYE